MGVPAIVSSTQTRRVHSPDFQLLVVLGVLVLVFLNAASALAQPYYRIDISVLNDFHIGSEPYSVNSAFGPDKVLAYSKSWDGGGVTQYSQGGFRIVPLTGDTTRIVDIPVGLVHQFNWNGNGSRHDGCTSIAEWTTPALTYLTEICGTNTQETLTLRTNTSYRVEANAATQSVGAQPAEEYTVTIQFSLPSTGPPPSPVITSFTANPATITAGQSSTLSWTTTNAVSVSISGIGEVQPANGSVSVSPTATTTYTLTATGNGGSITRTVTVSVLQPRDPPLILSFATSPRDIPEGSSTMLSWQTANATNVFLSGGVGAQPPTGTVTVTPTGTTTYHLTAFGAGGIAEGDAAVIVHAPPVITFTASPDRIAAGQSATLAWIVTGTSVVELDHGIGLRPASGSFEVKPSGTTSYLLTATGPGGVRVAQAEITVVIGKRRAARH
jgi:hypothetical protein